MSKLGWNFYFQQLCVQGSFFCYISFQELETFWWKLEVEIFGAVDHYFSLFFPTFHTRQRLLTFRRCENVSLSCEPVCWKAIRKFLSHTKYEYMKIPENYAHFMSYGQITHHHILLSNRWNRYFIFIMRKFAWHRAYISLFFVFHFRLRFIISCVFVKVNWKKSLNRTFSWNIPDCWPPQEHATYKYLRN